MDKEPPYNHDFVCIDHEPKPGGFIGQDPSTFIGKCVKLGFPAKDDRKEHMWVKVERLGKDTELEGVLDNDPQLDVGYACGDGVGFDVNEIEAVAPAPEEQHDH